MGCEIKQGKGKINIKYNSRSVYIGYNSGINERILPVNIDVLGELIYKLNEVKNNHIQELEKLNERRKQFLGTK